MRHPSLHHSIQTLQKSIFHNLKIFFKQFIIKIEKVPSKTKIEICSILFLNNYIVQDEACNLERILEEVPKYNTKLQTEIKWIIPNRFSSRTY